MNGRTLALLAGLGVVALAGGWYFGTATEPAEQSAQAEGGPMFPGLTAKLGAVAKVEIAHQGQTTVIEKRPDGAWGIASMHDYPVQETKLRGLFAGLTELRLAEKRTDDPSMLARLGLDDANANTLRLLDDKGQPIAVIVAGHTRTRSKGGDQVYIRRPGDNQAWLADGGLAADADATKWLDRNVMNVAHDRVASVHVSDGLTFGDVEGKFGLTEPADHPKLEDYKVEDISRALESLTFDAVKADADLQAVSAAQAVFTTTDGLAVNVSVFHAGKDVWARFTASGSSDAAKAEAGALNAKLAGWSYQIGSWKEKSLVPTIDDVKAAPPEPEKQ